MTDDLENISDAQLSEVFAVECTNYQRDLPGKRWVLTSPFTMGGLPVITLVEQLPAFATSLDALLRYIEADRTLEITRTTFGPDLWRVQSTNRGGCYHKSLPRAVCTALINCARADLANDKARLRSEHPPFTESA